LKNKKNPNEDPEVKVNIPDDVNIIKKEKKVRKSRKITTPFSIIFDGAHSKKVGHSLMIIET